MDFTIEIKLSGIDDLNYENQITYYRQKIKNKDEYKLYKDNVEYKGNKVIIRGTRSSKNKADSVFTNENTAISRTTTKSLLFLYFEYNAFIIDDIYLYYNKDPETKIRPSSEIVQVFSKKHSGNLKAHDCLFSEDPSFADTRAIELMFLTLYNKYDTNKLDHAWKCFNCIYNTYSSGKGREIIRLHNIEHDLVNASNCPLSAEYYRNNLNDEFINKFFLDKWYTNIAKTVQLKKEVNAKNINEELEKFNETPLNSECEPLVRIMLKRLKTHGLKDKRKLALSREFLKESSNKMSNDNEDTRREKDIEQAIKYISVYYAYFIRCNIFHATFGPGNFIFYTDDSDHYDKVAECVYLLCIDLFNHKFWETVKN